MAKNTQHRGLTKRHPSFRHTQQSPLRSRHQHMPWKRKRARNSLRPPRQIASHTPIEPPKLSSNHSTICIKRYQLFILHGWKGKIQQNLGRLQVQDHRASSEKYRASRRTPRKLHFPIVLITQQLRQNMSVLQTHICKHCVTPWKRKLNGSQNRKNLLIALSTQTSSQTLTSFSQNKSTKPDIDLHETPQIHYEKKKKKTP